ncbi:MerR family transcriptional regulator [Paenibacillus sp. PK3_47]|uniref:MerR family transcriptional regulator n=1 Tax=Paenibacillus sp. PK3_47 TaxID=2072642 RepID=UPI00201E0B88|nr:MerR family transcriptional regulator [Paenibacillus sp. PK3_47]
MKKKACWIDRHVRRESNNYRNYSEESIERLQLIKKFLSEEVKKNELPTVYP